MLIKNKIKSILAEQGSSIKTLLEELEKRGLTFSQSNFSNHLKRESFTYSELEIIADILGYDIKWEKRN